jgi:2-polyprenyl-6-methoxyphenol hydroxylase-like FAD-dependent oxidoreductase
MRTLAAEHNTPEINEQQPFLATFRCLWFRFPGHGTADLTIGTTAECHGPGAATQLFVGETTAVTGLYERLPEPTRERMRFTQDDEEAMVAKWGHLPVARGKTGKLTLGQAYAMRTHSGLVSLEEGVLKHWHWNSRIVLVGDAAHKFTPSTGAGCNQGIVDIVALANELHKLPARPSEHQLASAFSKYQDARQGPATRQCNVSGNVTKAATWGSSVAKILDCWVMSNGRAQKWFANKGAETAAATVVFDYIPAKERMIGKKAWVNAMPAPVKA